MPIEVRSAAKAGPEREIVAMAASSAVLRMVMSVFSLVFVLMKEVSSRLRRSHGHDCLCGADFCGSGPTGPSPEWEADLIGCRVSDRSERLQHAAIDDVSGSDRVARPVRAQKDEEVRQFRRCCKVVNRCGKKCAGQLIQSPPSTLNVWATM